MRRKLFDTASVLSLLLFVATVVLRVRSYEVMEYWHVTGGGITSFDGWVGCETGHYKVYVGRHGFFPIPGVQARSGFNSFGNQWQLTNPILLVRCLARHFARQIGINGFPAFSSHWTRVLPQLPLQPDRQYERDLPRVRDCLYHSYLVVRRLLVSRQGCAHWLGFGFRECTVRTVFLTHDPYGVADKSIFRRAAPIAD